MFGRLKSWKRVATRYERLAVHYLAGIPCLLLRRSGLNELPTQAAGEAFAPFGDALERADQIVLLCPQPGGGLQGFAVR